MSEDFIGSLNSPDPKIRRQAIWALGQRGPAEAVEPLINLMNATVDYKEKSLVIAAVSEIGIRALKPMSVALKEALEVTSRDSRKNAIHVLAQFYDMIQRIIQVLEALTADDSEHPEVRQTADWAVKNLKQLRN